MQNAPISKNLLITLIVVVAAGVIYFVFSMMSGGGSYYGGDIPDVSSYEAAPAEQAPPSPGVPEPSAKGPAVAGIGATPGGTIAPGAAPPEGGAPATPGGGVAPAPPGEPGRPEAPEAGEEPAEPEVPLSQEEKRDELAAFEQIESNDIIEARLEEARGNETEVIPEEDLPYPDTGRTDPLTIVNSAIPEELRPPRSGETDYDSILEYLIKSYGTEILDSIEIEVWSVMQIGLYELVNLSVNGRLATMSEGSSIDMPMGYQETLRVTVVSASQSLVTINLTYSNPYGSVSQTKTYIPKE